MRYALVLVTHGPAPHLQDVVEAFVEHVTPPPAVALAILDGMDAAHPPIVPSLGTWIGTQQPQQGFCSAVTTGLAAAASQDADYVFWLENDFIIQRPLDLYPLAQLLDLREHVDTAPPLAQVALQRNPCNPFELAAGGVVAAQTEAFIDRIDARGNQWLEHRLFFTTNPSLMRMEFVREAARWWPADLPECEGRFGIQLVEAGWAFAYWGSRHDPPLVHHVGERDGTGHGY